MARPPTDEPKRLKYRLTVRLNDAEIAAWKTRLSASGLLASDLMRDSLVGDLALKDSGLRPNKAASAVKSRPSKDAQRALFLLAQTSNNVNQLARQVNAAHLAGKVTKNMYMEVLVVLEDIAQRAKLMVQP